MRSVAALPRHPGRARHAHSWQVYPMKCGSLQGKGDSVTRRTHGMPLLPTVGSGVHGLLANARVWEGVAEPGNASHNVWKMCPMQSSILQGWQCRLTCRSDRSRVVMRTCQCNEKSAITSRACGLGSLQGLPVKIGTTQRRLAWPSAMMTRTNREVHNDCQGRICSCLRFTRARGAWK